MTSKLLVTAPILNARRSTLLLLWEDTILASQASTAPPPIPSRSGRLARSDAALTNLGVSGCLICGDNDIILVQQLSKCLTIKSLNRLESVLMYQFTL